jgi:hypothetical protein
VVALSVQLGHLPKRTIDRETAVRWMRDMHSLIPVSNGNECPALQLVEVAIDEDVAHFIRADTQAVHEDTLPDIPAA